MSSIGRDRNGVTAYEWSMFTNPGKDKTTVHSIILSQHSKRNRQGCYQQRKLEHGVEFGEDLRPAPVWRSLIGGVKDERGGNLEVDSKQTGRQAKETLGTRVKTSLPWKAGR